MRTAATGSRTPDDPRTTPPRPPIRWRLLLLALIGLASAAAPPAMAGEPLEWPELTRENRPWTRWWWLGSGVDEANLTRLLEQYREAGIGGVEICPIYGAMGYENRFIPFLSPRWMEMFARTTAEAKRLGLGVDLTTGTGWPFGGPEVGPEDASSRLVLKRFVTAPGTRLNASLPKGRLVSLRAVSDDGRQVDLAGQGASERVDWVAPVGEKPWRVYALVQSGPVQKVKRAAPGGEGWVLDPFSVPALERYLARFDRAFAQSGAAAPRAFFHDSFEYYRASWTGSFLDEFRKRRGYDLGEHLAELFGDAADDAVARVKCDYRETMAELHEAYVRRWTAWCHARGSHSRNQAHGAPANLIDLYSAVDIPETEIFRAMDERQVPMLKFASSAAHLGGRTLASAESFTWLGEHFQVALGDLKPAADFLFLCGINHLFYHGVPYSPEDAPWPGWLFYAAVNFGPQGGLWRDLPAFNAYIGRCQSILQGGKPAADLLLYFPMYDLWQTTEGLLPPFAVPGRWMWSEPFHAAAMTLWERGYGFDEVSDRLLAEARVEGGRVRLGDGSYRAIVIPRTRIMPPSTAKRLLALARDGATVAIQGPLPGDVPGLSEHDKRRDELKTLWHEAAFQGEPAAELRRAAVGKGTVLTAVDVDGLLRASGVPREPMADAGLRFVRRSRPDGDDYFVVNRGDRAVDGWVALATPARRAVLLDPRFDSAVGAAALRPARSAVEVYLQLRPGESRVLRTYGDPEALGPDARPWPYVRRGETAVPIDGTWKVEFVAGGPSLPAPFTTPTLGSWTALGDVESRRFAGTARYTIAFERPAAKADDWLLDLGRVGESARVKLNGQEVATLWCPPLEVSVGRFLRPGRNVLEVEVTNLAANRIADLDRRHVNWKSFHEINFVNIDYKPFDASNWPLRASGLLGPVRLVPLDSLNVAAAGAR